MTTSQLIQPQTTSISRRGAGGPRTPEGKAVSRQNSMKHGLYAKTISVLDTGFGDRADYESLVDDLFVFFRPQTCYEERLITELATHHMRLARVLAIENHMLRVPKKSQYWSDLLCVVTGKEYRTEAVRDVSGSLWHLSESVRKGRAYPMPEAVATLAAVFLERVLTNRPRWRHRVLAGLGIPCGTTDGDGLREALARILQDGRMPESSAKNIYVKAVLTAQCTAHHNAESLAEAETFAEDACADMTAELMRPNPCGPNKLASLRTIGDCESRIRRAIDRLEKRIFEIRARRTDLIIDAAESVKPVLLGEFVSPKTTSKCEATTAQAGCVAS